MPTYSLGTGGYQEYMPSQFQGLGENITGGNLAGMFGLSGSEWGEEFTPFATSLMEMMQGAPGEMQRLTGEAGQALGGAVRGARTDIGSLMEKTSGMGAGFMGFGQRGRATATGREAIQTGFGEEKAGIKSSLLGKIRSNIEDPFTNLYGQLASVYGGILAAGGTVGGVSETEDTGGVPYGWPSVQAYQQWIDDGANPDRAVIFGWYGEGTPGYKPGGTLVEETGGNGGDGNVTPMGDPGGGGSGGQSGYGNIKPWGFPGEKEPPMYYGTIY